MLRVLNSIYYVLLDNVIIQKDGDEENKAYEEDIEEETTRNTATKRLPIIKTTLTRKMKAKINIRRLKRSYMLCKYCNYIWNKYIVEREKKYNYKLFDSFH